jgi:hypothetical protein
VPNLLERTQRQLKLVVLEKLVVPSQRSLVLLLACVRQRPPRPRSSSVRETIQRFRSSTSAIYEFLCIALLIPVTSKIPLNSGLLS